MRTVEKLNLPDWWIGAGFIRNKIWDELFDKSERTPPDDVDVIFFDPADQSEECEKQLEKELSEQMPDVTWSVTNQIRMAKINGDAPYRSSEDALAAWPETATAVGVHLKNGQLELLAPHGIDDLVNGIVRPTPIFVEKKEAYSKRQAKKNWRAKWPGLQFMT